MKWIKEGALMVGAVAATAVNTCIMVFLLLVSLFSLSIFMSDDGAGLAQEEYGSFTPDAAASFDGRFVAEQKVERLGDIKYVRVDVFEKETGALAGSFYTERAWDFWGICWEEDSYDIWIQSADTGIHCYRYEEGTWSRDIDAVRPSYIVSRWEAKEAGKKTDKDMR